MTVARNHPKHEAEGLILDPIVGSRNIVSANGPLWKHLHKMLAPAFAISHITNMRPMVAAEVMTFRSMLSKKAETGQVFRLQDLAEYLAFDVIHTATFGFSADAQTQGSAVLEHFDDMCRADMRSKKSWNLVRNIFARRTRDAARKKLDPIIVDLIKERLNNVRRK
jgi:cytochrome P450